jgi:hypothetical protein
MFKRLNLSRTERGRKPPGWDYWGRREGLGLGAGGRRGKKKEKRNGIQRERAILKRELKKEKDDET